MDDLANISMDDELLDIQENPRASSRASAYNPNFDPTLPDVETRPRQITTEVMVGREMRAVSEAESIDLGTMGTGDHGVRL